MKKIPAIIVVLGLMCALIASTENKVMNKIEPLPRDLEIQLALSALPPHLRDGATVYVLNPDKGFEIARKGTNGFHAFVARTGDDTFRGDWAFTQYRDDILYRFPLTQPAPRHKCASFLMQLRCRPKVLLQTNLRK